MTPIDTSRLVLRRFTPHDAADLFAYLYEPTASCFLSLALPTLADAQGNPIYENTMQYALLHHEWKLQCGAGRETAP